MPSFPGVAEGAKPFRVPGLGSFVLAVLNVAAIDERLEIGAVSECP